MRHAIIFDCEYLTSRGAQRRFWCGPHDPDPIIVQIGAVRLGLDDGAILDTANVLVKPVNRFGQTCRLDPYLIELTGIGESAMDSNGVSLALALASLNEFSGGGRLWSWGKDELNIASSCYIAGVNSPIPACRFSNARKLLLSAGMPDEDIQTTGSGELAEYFGLDAAGLRAHDALDDALSLAYAIGYLLKTEQMSKDDFLTR